MQIHTDSFPVPFIALGAVKPGDFQAKTDLEGHGKTSPSGKPLFRVPQLRALRVIDGVPAGEDSSVSLAVEQPFELVFGRAYTLAGDVFVTPYVQQNGRLGLSVIAERIVPQTAEKPARSEG